jgi:hypothetical protein
MSAAARIKFENLLQEAKFAFMSGTPEGFARAEEHLAEARTIVIFERHLVDEGMAS